MSILAMKRVRFPRLLSTKYDMRLTSIAIDEITGVAGHVKQNDIVDVLWTGNIPSSTRAGTPSVLTKVLLEGVTVASVGQASTRVVYADNMELTSITLKLSQDEAALLAFAENVGEIKLILSHQDVFTKAKSLNKSGLEINYENIKKSKTISATRKKLIDVIHLNK